MSTRPETPIASGAETSVSAIVLTNRRHYLGWLVGLCTAGVSAVLSLPLFRYTIYPLVAQTTKTKWSDAGAAAEFEAANAPVQKLITVEQVDGWRRTVSEKAVYIRKDSNGQFQVFSAVCPHLGCSVQWRDTKGRFECPCHGASFTPHGVKTGGPAPRSMDALESEVQNGHLMVRYQYFRQSVPTKEVVG